MTWQTALKGIVFVHSDIDTSKDAGMTTFQIVPGIGALPAQCLFPSAVTGLLCTSHRMR